MTRQQFILSHGGTCANWRHSWSFINHKQRLVIFGAWDHIASAGNHKILATSWRIKKQSSRKNPGFDEALENIEAVQQRGYQLFIFRMFSDDPKASPIKLSRFEKELIECELTSDGNNWYATTLPTLSREGIAKSLDLTFLEGTPRQLSVNVFERSSKGRDACLAYHGTNCVVCSMNFADTYGPDATGFIHVHHVRPIASRKKPYTLKPKEDLVPICPNCHAAIHLIKNPALTITELRQLVLRRRREQQ